MSAIGQLLDRVCTWFKPEPAILLPPGTSLLAMEEFVPDGFTHGIEILNDDKTPMVFVVSVLEKELGLDTKACHTHDVADPYKRRCAPCIENAEEAEQIASAITLHAKDQGHPLSCKAVSVTTESTR